MRVLIAAGGTGGHIYPGLTIANVIRARYPGCEVIFVGTHYGLEKDIIPRAGYPLELIQVQYFRRALSLDLLKTGVIALKGLRQSFGIVGDLRPDVVVGTGGYVAGPVLLAAAMRRVLTFIQEQNALPGITNRLLGRFMQGIALGYAKLLAISQDGRVMVTGNPIRSEITAITKADARRRLQLHPDYRTVVVFGGSQGGLSINRAMRELAPRLNREPWLQVIHQTGTKSYADIAWEVLGNDSGRERGEPPSMVKDGCVRIVPYIYDMPAALAAADLVVGEQVLSPSLGSQLEVYQQS